MRVRIRVKLMLVFATLFIIPMILSLIIMNGYARHFGRESSYTLNHNNMAYVGGSVSQMFNAVYDFSLYLTMERNMVDYLTADPKAANIDILRTSAQDVLAILPFSNSYIKSVSIFSPDREQLNGGGASVLSFSDEELENADVNEGYYSWAFETENEKPHIYFYRLLRLPARLSHNLGYLKITIDTEEFQKTFARSGNLGADYYIMSPAGKLLYASHKDGRFEELAAGLTYEQMSDSVGVPFYMEQENVYVTPYILGNTSFMLFSVAPDDFTVSLGGTLTRILILYAVLCSGFCLLLAMIFTRIIVSPLKKLGTLMTHIQNEDYTVRFNATGDDEITVLARQFDAMSEKLQLLYTQNYLSDIKLKQSQLATLQSQINPHFLYNTLDTIYWMSEFHHTHDVSEMISALSSLFRLSLSGDENDMVVLSTELEHTSCYMHIQQIRYQDQLNYNQQVDVDAENLLVLKLILQPIVENAVNHGIGSVKQGVINIHIFRQDDRLIYEVRDSAGAADAEKINRDLSVPVSPDGREIGLKNINDRILLRYPPDCGIRCYIEAGETVFRVVLPLIKKGGDEHA